MCDAVWNRILVSLLILGSLAGCAPRTQIPMQYGGQVNLPPRVATGDRVDILFEDGELVSGRVVDWNEYVLVADTEGGRETYAWGEIDRVLDHRESEPPKSPTPAGAMRRFFLLMGAMALAASAID